MTTKRSWRSVSVCVSASSSRASPSTEELTWFQAALRDTNEGRDGPSFDVDRPKVLDDYCCGVNRVSVMFGSIISRLSRC